MAIGKLTLEIGIPHAQSLKDRRQVVRSMKAKLQGRFHASVAERNEGGTIWNRATLEAAVVTSSVGALRQILESMDRAAVSLAAGLSAEIEEAYAEILED